ncbi:hypothetical protein [Hydrogenophaga sp.]|uniref:hypothetical protein n=1 Tax=Hydrogenophaga sp. TaxID=1904254 RepID=UPI003D09ADD7
MKTNSSQTAPAPRWYGNATSAYTPLNTLRLPRVGGINDLAAIKTGVVGVILQDGSMALVDEEDYLLLQQRGWSARWTQRKVTGDNSYPSINHGDKIRSLCRIILNAQVGETIRYRNGDRNDLTRRNLILKAKGGKAIDFGSRSCPQAPILSLKERGRKIAAVIAAVGSASANDRIAAGKLAIDASFSRLKRHQATELGRRA